MKLEVILYLNAIPPNSKQLDQYINVDTLTMVHWPVYTPSYNFTPKIGT